jgi:hypothetical protein
MGLLFHHPCGPTFQRSQDTLIIDKPQHRNLRIEIGTQSTKSYITSIINVYFNEYVLHIFVYYAYITIKLHGSIYHSHSLLN